MTVEEKQSKFMLLDRLMLFIRQQEKPLNDVLAGYFSKLMTLLINRKQKSLLPYVFGAESDVIDCLLNHVYQKSISELVTKFLNISEDTAKAGDNSALASEIKRQQVNILVTLVDKLGPDNTDEDNLNACSILQDALDTKEFYSVVSRRTSLSKLLEFALPSSSQEGTESGTLKTSTESQNAALGVLTTLV